MPEFVIERTIMIVRKERTKVKARTLKAATRKAWEDCYEGNYENGRLVPLKWDHELDRRYVEDILVIDP